MKEPQFTTHYHMSKATFKSGKPKTVKRASLSRIMMTAGNERRIKCVLMPEVVLKRMRWVGIGWVDEGIATDEDKKKYPVVQD